MRHEDARRLRDRPAVERARPHRGRHVAHVEGDRPGGERALRREPACGARRVDLEAADRAVEGERGVRRERHGGLLPVELLAELERLHAGGRGRHGRAHLRLPRGVAPLRHHARRLAVRGHERVGRHSKGELVRERRHVAAQEEAHARAVGRLAERVAPHVEVAGHATPIAQVVVAVRVGEAPEAVPVLQRAHRARHDAAHAAEHARTREVPLRDAERLGRHARVRARDGREELGEDGVRVRAPRRQRPRPRDELRMVHVEVVVHVVVARLAHRHERRVVSAAVLTGEERLHAERAEELTLAPREVVLHVRHEGDERGVVPGGDLLGVVRDVLRERGVGGALRGEPFLPRGLHRRLLLDRVPAPGEVPLVDERDERQARLVLVRAARVRVHVREQVAGERLPVLERGRVDADEVLVDLLRNLSVAVDADVAPHHGTRREEVRRHVDALLHRAEEQVVEALRPFLVERQAVLRPLDDAVPALVVVNAHGVVAEAHEARDELVGEGLIGEARAKAEVYAVETLVHARLALELEVPARVLQPAVLAGGGVLQAHPGEVERAAGLDVLAVVERDPVRALLDDDRLVDGHVHAVRRGEDAREGALVALPERAPRVRPDAQSEGLHPLAVVLDHQRHGTGERQGERLSIPRRGEGDRLRGGGIEAHLRVLEFGRELALLPGRVRPRAAHPRAARQGERENGRLGVQVDFRRGRGDVDRAAVGRRQQGGVAVPAPVLLVEQLELRRAGRLVGEREVRPHARGRAVPPFVVDRERHLRALAAHAQVAVDAQPRLKRSARRRRRPGDRAGSQNLLCRKFHAVSISYLTSLR